MLESKKKGGRPTPSSLVSCHYALAWGCLQRVFLAKYYFDQAIMSVQQTNAMNVQTLEARLESLSADIAEIKGIELSRAHPVQL